MKNQGRCIEKVQECKNLIFTSTIEFASYNTVCGDISYLANVPFVLKLIFSQRVALGRLRHGPRTTLCVVTLQEAIPAVHQPMERC